MELGEASRLLLCYVLFVCLVSLLVLSLRSDVLILGQLEKQHHFVWYSFPFFHLSFIPSTIKPSSRGEYLKYFTCHLTPYGTFNSMDPH
ncbi:hypothetical protein BKA65DRAFT_11307 [Rhexocercosporidium sp. MPI-PUGE-AT-0058]|nr:hypothetical protein BKA65DRAFT_11307 [Rhexocercosporidium sp. MPI-PUGE-AT-0058]